MGTYASRTTVEAGQSLSEIERTLERYGATEFAYAKNAEKAALAFHMRDRRMRLSLALPKRDEFLTTEGGKKRTSQNSIDEAHQQAIRQRWRALALVVKAKLEAVDAGIETFEQAWMPYMLLPNGMTAVEWMSPQIEEAYNTGEMPPLLVSGNQ